MDWASYSKLRDRAPYTPPLAAQLLPDTAVDEGGEDAYNAACIDDSPPWDGLTQEDRTAWARYACEPGGELAAVYMLPAAVKPRPAPLFEADRLFTRFAA